MTTEELQEKFILRLLKAIKECDDEMHAAYVKRGKAITELNEWLVEAWKEATDGN